MTDIKLTLTVAETNAILKALGEFPYSQVYQLIAKIQQEAAQQVSADLKVVETPLEAGSENG